MFLISNSFTIVLFTDRLDIERYYGKPKAIAKRIPVIPSSVRANGTLTCPNETPTKDTAAITMVETETELESETEDEDGPNHVKSGEKTRSKAIPSRHRSTPSNASSGSTNGDSPSRKKQVLSQHDLLNKYFRRDTVVLKNLDLLRSVD